MSNTTESCEYLYVKSKMGLNLLMQNTNHPKGPKHILIKPNITIPVLLGHLHYHSRTQKERPKGIIGNRMISKKLKIKIKIKKAKE